MKQIHGLISQCVLLMVVLTGCATSRQARETASTLAVYTTKLKANAEVFADSRTELLQMRKRAINLLEGSAVDLETRNALTQQTWSLANREPSAKLLNGLLATANFAEQQHASLADLREQHTESVRNAKSAANFQTAKLAEVSKGLGKLADKTSLTEDVTFLSKFVSEVQSQMKDASTNSALETKAGAKIAGAKIDSLMNAAQ